MRTHRSLNSARRRPQAVRTANRVHYDDTWNLDHTIARFVLPWLRRLREGQVGIPGDFAERGTWEEQQEAWDAVLQRMILAFELILRDDDLPYDHLYDPPLTEEDHGNWAEVISDPARVSQEGYQWLRAIEEDRDRVIGEGLMLFAIYFRSLWD